MREAIKAPYRALHGPRQGTARGEATRRIDAELASAQSGVAWGHMLDVAGGGSRRSHATWEDNGRWMTVTITWEDDCRWMTVRGVGCGECNMGSVYSAVEDSVDGSAGGQVFGQWSRASGGRTQRDISPRYSSHSQPNRTGLRSVSRTFSTLFIVVSVDDRPTTTEPLVASARPASTREQACE